MDMQLKNTIKSLLNYGEALEGVSDLEGMSVKEVLRMDLLHFLLYLFASDGTIDETEAVFIKEYLDWDMPPVLWKRFIEENNVYSTDFESTVPVGLTVFLKADNNALRKDRQALDISDLYIRTFESIGNILIKVDGNINNQEKEDLNIYISMLKDYVHKNSLRSLDYGNSESASGITKNTQSRKPQKGVQNKSAKFLICPKCNKLILNDGTYCKECFADFEDMFFEDKHYKNPLSEVKYYDLSYADVKR